jgi:hypothetical protein
MRVLNIKTLKLKAVLLSHDGGRSWIVSRQYYLTDLETNLLLDESVQGLFLKQNQENTNDNEQRLPRG